MKKVKFITGNKGSAIVAFAAALLVIVGFISLTVDIGLAINEKARVANATDSAALAGAQELPDNVENAVNVAKEYAVKNGMDPNSVVVEILEEGHAISVSSKKEVAYFFARALGIDKGEVNAKAVAKVLPVSGVLSGVRPFAIESQNLSFGEQYMLKEGGGDGSSGNYGALSLGGMGASNYWYNIVNGYEGELRVGDYISTEPGNMSGPTESGINTLIRECNHCPECTFDKYEPDCARIVTVVIVDSLDVNGREDVKIVGFASFFLEGVAGSGNESIVTGRFIRTMTQGELSEGQKDYGLRGIKLVN